MAYDLAVIGGGNMGAALLEGKWPYLQTWESDFPGLVFLQAGQIFAMGRSGAAFRLFDLLVQLANAWLIFRMANRSGGRAAALIAPVLFCLIYQGYGPWNTAQREGFGMFFILGGYWLFFTAERRSPAITPSVIDSTRAADSARSRLSSAKRCSSCPCISRSDRTTSSMSGIPE